VTMQVAARLRAATPHQRSPIETLHRVGYRLWV